ncbi:MAG: hypothetical protein J6J57_06795, partial [Alistipes sp.]|nr:hypothetical protein [Alistipes sp.]
RAIVSIIDAKPPRYGCAGPRITIFIPISVLYLFYKDTKQNGTDDAERAKKVNLFTFFRAARRKSLRSRVKTESGKRKTFSFSVGAESGTDARSKSRGCSHTMPCKKEEKPAKQD